MTDPQPAFNYRYFVQKAAHTGGRVLDYGCGGGQIVALGLECGLDIWGADTYAEYYNGWGTPLTPQVRDRVKTIRNGVIDFPDGHFNVVLSNQVLEHVTDPEAVIAEVAHRIALIPIELLQLNKRIVHRQMDAMGMRAGIRAGTELCALGTHTAAMRDFIGATREKGLTGALQERDAPFGDYRTTG